VVLGCCLPQVCTSNHGFVRFLLATGFFLSLLGFGLRCYVKALPSFVWVSELTEQQFQLPILSQLAWPGFFLVTASSIWSGLCLQTAPRRAHPVFWPMSEERPSFPRARQDFAPCSVPSAPDSVCWPARRNFVLAARFPSARCFTA
jgi:predicted dienelactone hydrolase